MTLERTESGKYVGAGALVKGMALKTTAVYKELDLATGVTDPIGGVSLQPAVQNDNVGVALPGCGTVKVVAGAALAVGIKIAPGAGGKFVANAVTQTNYWGTTMTATGAADELCEMLFQPGQNP